MLWFGDGQINWHPKTWWRHQMETFSAFLVLCEGIHRSPVDSPHKGWRRGALMFSLICAWTNGWASNRDAGDLWRYRPHYDVTVTKNMGKWITPNHHGVTMQPQRNKAEQNPVKILWNILLTYWGQDKMVHIFQTTFLNAFIFLKENVWVLIKTSLKYVRKGSN